MQLMAKQKILLVDNEDSFTYNLKGLLESLYCSVHIVNGKLEQFSTDDYSHIIFSPGPGLPDDFPLMKYILHNYKNSQKILGICLGHQAIALHFGASLYQLIKPLHGRKSYIISITTDRKSCISRLPKKFIAGHYHSWAVDQRSLRSDLHATCINSNKILMGIVHSEKKIEGVQFHPESYLSSIGPNLMRNWISY